MKYSVRGAINTIDDSPVMIAEINKYQLWRLVTADLMNNIGGNTFTFEAWVNIETDKTVLFDDLKPFVDRWGGWIDWHICSHDEPITQPCVIAETYRGG